MTSENKDEIEIVSYTDNEMQSWVFNHLPLSIEQKILLLKELEDEYRNPAKADEPLTENCFKNYLKGACALFLNLVDHDPYTYMG